MIVGRGVVFGVQAEVRGGTTRVKKYSLSVSFFVLESMQKGHAESAFRDTCRTSSGQKSKWVHRRGPLRFGEDCFLSNAASQRRDFGIQPTAGGFRQRQDSAEQQLQQICESHYSWDINRTIESVSHDCCHLTGQVHGDTVLKSWPARWRENLKFPPGEGKWCVTVPHWLSGLGMESHVCRLN